MPEPDKLPPMTLRSRIALPGVYGRMDHYGWDSKRGILLVSALGNNTVEIVDSWKQVHTIAGLEHPQASVYLPGVDRIAVSSQSGKLRFYDAAGYALIKTAGFRRRCECRQHALRPGRQAALRGLWGAAGRRARHGGSGNHGAGRGIQARQPSGGVCARAGRAADFRQPAGPGIDRGHRPHQRRGDQVENPRPAATPTRSRSTKPVIACSPPRCSPDG